MSFFTLVILIVFIISAILSRIVCPNILSISYKKNLYDLPDSRRIHQVPVSRLGGTAFAPVIMVCFFLASGVVNRFFPEYDMTQFNKFILPLAGFILLYLVGVYDDLLNVGYKIKLLYQIFTACLFPLSGIWINTFSGMFGLYDIPAWIGIPMTIMVVIYIINAINLIDGVDGLAAGLSSLFLIIVGIFCFQYAYLFDTIFIAATLGVLCVFLYYNMVHPKGYIQKMFMGDTGSLTLGYIVSYFVIKFSSHSVTFDPVADHSQIIVFSALIVPLFDVMHVIVLRMHKHGNIFQPDKNHIHHFLLKLGFTHVRITLSLILITLIFVALNYILSKYINLTIVLVIDIILWVSIRYVLQNIIKHPQTEK